MTTTVPVYPSPFAGGEPFERWIERIGDQFREREPAPRVNRFLMKLLAQSELAEGSSRLLFAALQDATPRVIAEAARKLELCANEAHGMDEAQTEQLRPALITPFDSEDMKSMSVQLARLVDSSRDVAREVAATNWFDGAAARIQIRIVDCHDAMTAIFAGLVGKEDVSEARSSLWTARRAAKSTMRAERLAVFTGASETGDALALFAGDGVLRRQSITLDTLKRLNMMLYWAAFKNG